jgi:hypothetical protein
MFFIVTVGVDWLFIKYFVSHASHRHNIIRIFFNLTGMQCDVIAVLISKRQWTCLSHVGLYCFNTIGAHTLFSIRITSYRAYPTFSDFHLGIKWSTHVKVSLFNFEINGQQVILPTCENSVFCYQLIDYAAVVDWGVDKLQWFVVNGDPTTNAQSFDWSLPSLVPKGSYSISM